MEAKALSSIYLHILSRLELTPAHRDNLLDRGLSKGEINAIGYKSWPLRRNHIISSLEKEFSDLSGVPGMFKNDRGEWQISGPVGVAIPVLNRDGDIMAIKIRPDTPVNPANKYVHLSSNPKKDPDGSQKYPEGASAKISCHWPARLKSNQTLTKIRVTEGELKADIASNISNIYTISMPGVGLWREAMKEIDSLKEKPTVHLAYDSDKDREHHPEYGTGKTGEEGKEGGSYLVARSLIEFYSELELNGYKVVVEDWDAKEGKGIDDVLAAGGEDRIRELSKAEITKFIRDHTPKLPTPTQGWLYIIGTKRFVNLANGREYDKEQYHDLFCHITGKKSPTDIALRSREFQKVDLPCFWPRRDQVFEKEGLVYYNGWKPSGLEGMQGDISKFLRHLAYILPDEREQGIMLDFMAHNIQHEGEKIHWALLLQGEQGTGKSYFGYVMRKMLGASNVSNPNNENLHENYTAWQANCSLVVIEEMMARGRLELMNKLKPMITQDIASIREMHKPVYEQPNRFNMLMFTNHQDAIIIDNTDRRYCILFSPAKPMEREAYYKELWDWTDSSLRELHHFFMARDLSKFNPKGHAPMTEGKKILIQESRMPLQEWVETSISLLNWPFQGDIVTTQHLVECLPPYLRNVTPQLIGRTLKAAGATQLKQVNLCGMRMRPWAIRRQEVWAGASPEAIRDEYEKWGDQAEPGGNPLRESKPM